MVIDAATMKLDVCSLPPESADRRKEIPLVLPLIYSSWGLSLLLYTLNIKHPLIHF